MNTCDERPRRLIRAGLGLVGSTMVAAAVVAAGAGASPASAASHAAPAASAAHSAAPAGGCIIVRCAV
jgi:acetoin utilization deacetylase AcuC-like enzyme